MYSFSFRLTFLTYVLSAGVCVFPWLAQASDRLPNTLSLNQAVTQALQQNLSLKAQQKHALAQAALPAQAGSLPDPVLSLAALSLPVDTFSTSQENMTQMQLGLTQALPFPGTLALQAEAASYVAQAAEDDVQELKLLLVQQVVSGWWNLLYLDKALATVARNQVLLRQLIRIAETKYKVGKGLQQDVLLAQLELSKLLDVAIKLKALRLQSQAQLNQRLQQPAHQTIVLPQMIDESLIKLADAETLTKQALQQRPLLAKQFKLQQAARSRVALADKSDYPDFTLSAKYGWRDNSDAGVQRADLASVSLSMTMPFFTGDKQHAEQQQRRAELARESFRYQDVQTKIGMQISVEHAAYERAQSQSLLFRTGIIPQAKQTVASMLAAYQVNKVDFLNLVRAQITLYNYETQYWQVLAEANQRLARLYAVMGKDKEFSDE